MALTTARDISVVLSGGSTNLNPNLSLGGNPSSAPIMSGSLNNLFDDVSPKEALEGQTDYRCIYFFNDGDTTIYNIQVFLESETENGSNIQIGLLKKNEFQRLIIAGTPTGGSITLSFDEATFVSYHRPDLEEWVDDFQASLNSLMDENDQPLLNNVLVTAQIAGSNTLFDIQFLGNDSAKNHPALIIIENNLTPLSEASIITIQEGSPVNTIAPSIGSESITPAGVVFSTELLTVPKLGPSEGFPLWIKRVTEPEAPAVAEDGVTIRFYAESLAS